MSFEATVKSILCSNGFSEGQHEDVFTAISEILFEAYNQVCNNDQHAIKKRRDRLFETWIELSDMEKFIERYS